ncbi:clostripain-related cysteine peptidase [uncultured Bacteroides sp.]|uniref:clostripain-related cysteine peptidase n=1 Tax=uncultured Bacteroides sp. TaxID=162156 RepID=UPI0026753A84|nr:clostripain-related cysteine peptidase [uncultured Bacteroides sp.]
MKKIKILSVFVCLAFWFVSCQNEEEPEKFYSARTVLVYIAGDNSLGQAGFDSEDVEEMIRGMKNTDGTENNLLVYWAGYHGDAHLIRLVKNGKGEVRQETVMDYGNQNSVSVDVMKDVFRTAFSNYPAKSYGIVFWSHGDGWRFYQNPSTRWWGQDASDGDYRMNIPDLHEALSVAPHFDFILFDACYMQSVEVVYQLRDCADYFIGSPTEIPGPGAPYEEVVPALFSQDNPAINIAKNYYAVYEEKYDNGANMSNDNWTGGVSISVVKSSELPALAAATREFLLAGTKKNNYIDVNNSGILCYDPYRDKSYHDMMGLMRKMKEDDRAQAFENYENIYRNTVVWMKSTDYNYCTYPNGVGEMASMKGFQGLSTYILRDNQSIQETYYRQSVEWYSAAGWSDIDWVGD